MRREELEALILQWGERPFRAKQVWNWLHVRLAAEVAAMTDLSLAFREKLSQSSLPLRPEVSCHRISADGTEKWLLSLGDGQRIETVFIPEEDRGTLCVSSQAGCSLACPFCWTGAQGLARNLKAAEIVEQVLLARAEVAQRDKKLTNVVFMGMGEPLYNLPALLQACHILLDPMGLAIGTRKITVSTAGVVPRMHHIGRELGVNLAISLHSVRDATRDVLVPLNRKYNLAALRQAALSYPFKQGRRITWEYVLLDGVNDSPEEAREMVRYLREIPSKVNLIPFNPWPGVAYAPTPMERVVAFQEILHHGGLVTVIRDRRGADIEAACGQLKGALQDVRPRNRDQDELPYE
ncbi:MAG: 23S rRNA (adenine(2503)-C(2))-methyltransferase RlmN [Magnetococcales bacterium]|nr:23S rRNA (adenine(2503)-C(2))-methyltransferase RlmN [Magnetococcales bacterium]